MEKLEKISKDIRTNFQPRKVFDQEKKLEELAQSKYLIQPIIIVRKSQ